MSVKLYSMRFAVVFSFSEKRSVLVKSLLYFGMSLSGAKYICKNNVFCIKDTAPTFFTCESKYPPDTAHTNSSREQLPVTKKAVGCVREKERRWFYRKRINDLQQRVHYDNSAGKTGVHHLQNDVPGTVYPCRRSEDR